MTRYCWLGWSTDWLLLGLAGGQKGWFGPASCTWAGHLPSSSDAAHIPSYPAMLPQGPLQGKPRQRNYKTSLLSLAPGYHKAALSPLDGACLAAAEPRVSSLPTSPRRMWSAPCQAIYMWTLLQ